MPPGPSCSTASGSGARWNASWGARCERRPGDGRRGRQRRRQRACAHAGCACRDARVWALVFGALFVLLKRLTINIVIHWLVILTAVLAILQTVN